MGFFKSVGAGLVSAAIGGMVAVIVTFNGWIWSGLYDKLVTEITATVIDRLDFKVIHSDKIPQEVPNFGCPAGSRLVTASCVGFNPSPQAAVGPQFNDDGTFNCYRYGPVVMPVQAQAICFKGK